MLSLPEAQAWVTSRCAPLAPVELFLDDAHGCVLAEEVHSSEPVPPFANTAMDGFAVRAADVATVPCELEVVATLPAGAEPTVPVGPGQAVRIMTGAAIPAGADAIVPVENIDPTCNGERVRILEPASVGDAIRPAGEDIAPGQLGVGQRRRTHRDGPRAPAGGGALHR